MTPERSILIVDDDRDFAELIAIRCRALGLTVETAHTPLAAITSMTARQPDVLCLDVHMPTGNGLDLCEFLVHEGKQSQKPVIVLTGCSDDSTIVRTLKLSSRYVRKSPDVWPRLRHEILDLLGANPPAVADGAMPQTSNRRELCHD